MLTSTLRQRHSGALPWILCGLLALAAVPLVLVQAQEIADPPLNDSAPLGVPATGHHAIARLGAIMAATPHDGLYVSAITPLGAADRAGMRPGDHLLNINGRDIESTADLNNYLDSLAVDAILNMTVRREGTEHAVSATLLAQDLPAQSVPYEETTGTLQTGWLGVMVDEAPVVVETGVFVKQIWRESPAFRAGLVIDDRIVRIGDTPIHSPRDVTETIRDLPPYAKVTMVVDRRGAIHEIPVQLGDMSESRTSFHPQHWTTVGDPNIVADTSDVQQTLFEQNQRLERLIMELSRNVETLQAEVRSLRGDVPDTNLDGTGTPVVPATPIVPIQTIP